LHERLVVALLLALFVLQCVLSMRQTSPTWDEVGHLPAGYTYWKTHDFRLYPSNPPLIKLISAAPLLLMDVKLSLDNDYWQRQREIEFGQLFLYETNSNAGDMIFWGRLTIVALATLLGFFLFKWTKELFGRWPAFTALVLYIFNPNIIAHGQVTTSDLGFCLFFFLAIYTFYRVVTRPTWMRLLAAGLAFGLAMASKFTAIILLPIYCVVLLALSICKRAEIKNPFSSPLVERFLQHSWWRIFATAAAMILAVMMLGYGVIAANYGFRAEPLVRDADEQAKLEALLARVPIANSEAMVKTATSLARSVPIPGRDYFTAFSLIMGVTPQIGTNAVGVGRNKFLMGETSPNGFWYFPFVAFLTKTPVPLILLFVAGLFLIRKDDLVAMLFLLVPVALMWLGTLKKPDFAYRYVVLPSLPFMMMLAGRVVTARCTKKGLAQWVLAALLLWNAGSAVAIFPHHLAYFNELVGGPKNGYKYMLDSNLDWGQDLPTLKKYMDEHKIERIKLAYAGTADPKYYDIDCERLLGVDGYTFDPDFDPGKLPSCAPTRGIIAISATCLQNIGGFYPHASYDWLKQHDPVAVIGHSIFVYDLRQDSLSTNTSLAN
jgi:4-amino-4-deoxy-L-arabinose transferase-like glycosyltransferase